MNKIKHCTEQEIYQEIDKLKNSIKHDWSKFGDLSEWVRKDMVKHLNKIKRMMKAPRIVRFPAMKGGKKIFVSMRLKK